MSEASCVHRRTDWSGLVAVNITAVIFGSIALFGKLDVSPVWIVAARGGFAALTLFLLALARRSTLRVTPADTAYIVATGAILALHWVTFFISVQDAGVAVATLTFATFPLITVLIDAAIHRRVPAIVELAAGAAIIAAVALLMDQGLPATAQAYRGAVVGLGSAACFSLFSIGSQQLGARVNSITLSCYQNTMVALVLVAFLPFAARAPQAMDWAVLAALGVIATATMHQLYFFALKHLPASVCGGFVSLEPVYAIVFAAVLFGDPIGLTVILSGALIVGASLVLLWKSPTPAEAAL
jgi:drug/metabolite transporter (DMT)-like permease